ncbi:uncharacterized protein LOC132267431 [Cornus florida]|uniref:uncharacterized protein LOC132267431 n=1 Tax=Cornus florida TaxID=4283 RepID=UPI00289A7882|nr:uncharacterized protein LOC132267431 [Cornus florida]
MEEDQGSKFVCKVCNKTFFSGKSLGGHMRGHMAMISTKKREARREISMGSEGFGHTGYGLRENPKKVWKVSDSNTSDFKLEKLKNSNMGFEDGFKAKVRVSDSKHCVCEECGKGFDSKRALSVHKRSHSMKEREREENHCKECGKGFDSMRALFGHMRSHSKRSRLSRVSDQSLESHSGDEAECLIRRKRSRTRYRVNSSFSNFNASSSSVCEIKEVEEIAMCLMMLSRGVKNWADFNSVNTEFSYTNFVNSEAQSLNPDKGIANIGDDTCKMKAIEKLDSCVSVSGNSLSDKSVSQFADFNSEPASEDDTNVELGVSVDGLCDSEIEKGFESTEAKLEKDVVKNVGFGQTDLELMRSSSSKKARFDVHDTELEVNSCDGTNFTKSSSGILKNSPKENEYKCRTCNKIFHSYQALGGHRTSHRTITGSSPLKVESCEKGIQTNVLSDTEANFKLVKDECNENSIEDGLGRVSVTRNVFKRSKEHECPVCFKVFASGQALGGHKRAHYIGLTESRAKETVIIKQELLDVHTSFDLNLPVKEADGDVSFNLWWVGTDHKREPLVISN